MSLWAYKDVVFLSDISDDDSEVDKDYVQPSSASSNGEEGVLPHPRIPRLCIVTPLLRLNDVDCLWGRRAGSIFIRMVRNVPWCKEEVVEGGARFGESRGRVWTFVVASRAPSRHPRLLTTTTTTTHYSASPKPSTSTGITHGPLPLPQHLGRGMKKGKEGKRKRGGSVSEGEAACIEASDGSYQLFSLLLFI